MRGTSARLRERLARNSVLTPKATLTLADGRSVELSGDDFVGLTWEQSTSSDSSFDIGAAVIGRCDATLNNHDDRFSSYDFGGATLVPSVGARFGDVLSRGDEGEGGLSLQVYEGKVGHLTAIAWRGGEPLSESALAGTGTIWWWYGKASEVPATPAATGTSFDADPGRTVVCALRADGSTLCFVSHDVTTEEWVAIGSYLVDQPDSYGGTIQLSCLDRMSLLERPYSEVGTKYPASLAKVVTDIAKACGVELAPSTEEYLSSSGAPARTVSRRPDDSSATCLDMMGYACQAMCRWARCDERGRLVIGWYDSTAFDGESWLVGGNMEDYSSGDSADGGTLSDYSSGSKADGGDFDSNHSLAQVVGYTDLTLGTDDVAVTGVQVTASNEVVTGEDGKEQNGRDGETALSGSKGYVLEVSDNPLIEYGTAKAYADLMAASVVGMAFRPFSASCVVDPSIEAGDPVAVIDRKLSTYRSFVTTVQGSATGHGSLACAAESASRNSAASSSAATKAIREARAALRRESDSRERAQTQLADKLANSTGLYHSEVVTGDGSTVHLLHDRPTAGESKVVWRMAADAVSVSTDGGKTWATGLTADGTAILNRIYALGIDADYITAGVISDRAGKSYWNLNTGELSLASVTTEEDLKEATKDAIASVAFEYAQNDSATKAPTTGWSAKCPKWVDGKFIWSRTVTTAMDNTTATSEPTCITGARGSTGVPGQDGEDGTSVTVSKVEWAASPSGTVVPAAGWQGTVPKVDKGKWLWCRTTYSDGTKAEMCSYMGTDGADGKSVSVESVTKSGKVTTVTLDDGGTTRTIAISDGADGPKGAAGARGADGRTSYTHFAWADSADGKAGFTTSGGAGKPYMGVYSDFEEADSGSYADYTWTLVKGGKGDRGATGVGVSEVTSQYYLSTSSTTCTGGSWGAAQPTWIRGHFIWTRDVVKWTNGTTTYTTPQLASAINKANETASDLALNMKWVGGTTGLLIGHTTDGSTFNTVHTRIDGSSFAVLDSSGKVLSRFSKDSVNFMGSSFGSEGIELGKNMPPDATISLLGGLGLISSHGFYDVDGNARNFLSISSTDAVCISQSLKRNVSGDTTSSDVTCMQGDVTINAKYDGPSTSESSYLKIGTSYLRLWFSKNSGIELRNNVKSEAKNGSNFAFNAGYSVADLNTCGPGVFSYNASTENRPTDYGVCLSFVAGNGNWLFQLALPTKGEPHWRRNINGAGWEGWWQWTTA